jgi:ATP-dependent exoDNAse (exonuclease V) beta subunit
MADNFDLKKFLKESKAIENLNPIIGKNTNIHGINENNMRDKIREMILAELAEEVTTDNAYQDDAALNADYDPVYEGEDEEDEDYSDYFFDIDTPEEDLEEAKKKKDEEVEDVETTDIETTDTTEEIPAEDAPAEEAPTTGGLEDVAANMEGTEGELMDHLMNALKIAKGMGNEKLTTQVGNTLKFFVGEYIGGGE